MPVADPTVLHVSATRRLASGLLALALLFLQLAPVLATSITTDLWVYQYGDTVTVSGDGFGANEGVELVTTDPYAVEVDRGMALTDEFGNFVYQFVLLSDVPGIYDVVATGLSSGLSAATQFDPTVNLRLFGTNETTQYPASPGEGFGNVEQGTTLAFDVHADLSNADDGTSVNWTVSQISGPTAVLTGASGTFTNPPSVPGGGGNPPCCTGAPAAVGVSVVTGGLTIGTNYIARLQVTGTSSSSTNSPINSQNYYFNFTVVAPANSAPTANDDSPTVVEDSGSNVIDVLANDTDPDGDSLTVTAVGSASHGTASLVSGAVRYTPAANYCGPDSFTYDISDGHGGNDQGTVNVTVSCVNDAPTVMIDSGDTPVDEGPGEHTYTFTVSDPDVGDHFSVIGDPDCGTGGAYVPSSIVVTSGGGSFECVFADGPATPILSITVQDDSLATGEDTFPVTVDNVAPTIAISGASNVDEGSPYSLTLGAITDPGTDTVTSWTVHWGDGSSNTYVSGGVKTHTYADGPNTYNITVDLTDEDGTYLDQANPKAVTVDNVAPTVTLTGPNSADEGQTKSYSFTSSDPGADSFALVSQSCGANGTLSNATFTPATGAGGFDCTFPDGDASSTVSVTVEDSDGADSNTDPIVVIVDNVAPSVTASWASGSVDCRSNNTLTFSFSDPGVNDALWTVEINWGDGNTESYQTAIQGSQPPRTHSYAVPGPYTATVSVTDKDSDSGSDSDNTITVAQAYTITFLQPFDYSTVDHYVINQAKAGRAVPVKARIFDVCAQAYVTGGDELPRIAVSRATTPNGTTTDGIEFYADAGASNDNGQYFRWSSDGFWIYNLDTRTAWLGGPLVTGQTYRIDVYIGTVKVTDDEWALLKQVK